MDRPHDHDKRMAAARARAEWELGDESWAGLILGAYFHPDEDTEALRDEKNPDPIETLEGARDGS
jgi:hypothetical protein